MVKLYVTFFFDCLLLPNGSPYIMHLSFPLGGGYVDKCPYSTEFSLPSPITNKRPHYVTSSFSSPVTGYLKMTVPALSLAHVGFEFKDILDFSFIFVRNLFKWKIHRSLRFTYFNGWNKKNETNALLSIQLLKYKCSRASWVNRFKTLIGIVFSGLFYIFTILLSACYKFLGWKYIYFFWWLDLACREKASNKSTVRLHAWLIVRQDVGVTINKSHRTD